MKGNHRICVVLFIAALSHPLLAQTSLRDEAQAALKKAATYYRTKVASHGGYVYFTSEDLTKRWGEGEATPDQIFTEPPGTHTGRYRNGNGAKDGRNHSSLDDNQTQSSIQFLARMDRALEFKDATVH